MPPRILTTAALVLSGFALGWGAHAWGPGARGEAPFTQRPQKRTSQPVSPTAGTSLPSDSESPSQSGEVKAAPLPVLAMLEWLRTADPEGDDTLATLDDWLLAVPCDQALELTEYYLGQPDIFGEQWGERQWPLRTILDHVVRTSPSSALAIFRSLPEEAPLGDECMDFLDTWARRDIDGARGRLLEALHEAPAGWARARMAAALMRLLPRLGDVAARVALVDELTRLPEAERPDFGERLATSVLERVQQGAGLRDADGWLAGLGETPERRAEVLTEVACSLVGANRAQAKEAVRLALAADPAVDFDSFFESLTREAPEEADAFARDLLDPVRRADAVKTIAGARLEKDGAAGTLQWATGIADPSARRIAGEQISRSSSASFSEAWSASLLMGADASARAQQFQIAFRWVHDDREAAARAVPPEYLAIYDAARARIEEGLSTIQQGPAGASLRIALRFEPNPTTP